MTVTDQLTFSKNALNKYAQKIGALIDQEVATEESFYPDFRDLLKNYFSSNEFEVISVPKAESTEDKPDFIIYMDNIPIINIEAKNPYDPIDKWILATSKNRLFEQIYRYRGRENGNIPVIITDFLQILVIDNDSPNSMDSDHQVKYKFKIVDDSSSKWKSFTNAKKNFEGALNYACEDITISITKISSMIPHLVKYAKKLKNKIIEVFNEASNPMKTYLESIRNDFLKSIFSSDKEKKSQEFADLFSQTLIYGGFIAWMRFCKDGNSSLDFAFNIVTRYLPYGTFIYSIFSEISVKLSPEVQNKIISKIERIFQSSNFERITENTETLMITFYSDFLQKYDPVMAKDRGIVYTPHPIVSYITRGVDCLLKKYYNKSNGVASSDIYFLDPAAGTMAFPIEILRLAKSNFEKKYSKQPSRVMNEFNDWVHKIFLKNTFAFEILMAPYVLGHFRINMILEDLGAKIDPLKDRVNLFLFNTLMSSQTTINDFRNVSIGEEIIKALNIRKSQEILVVLSNPPYNVSSQNKIDWIENKMDLYKHNLDEKNIQPLSDDYVKFIRFAQWKLCEAPNCQKGIVGFITNNTYLDGRIFRVMRLELCKSFDYIYITNLHGKMRGGEQGNVFDISVGVSIVFFIRLENHSDENFNVFYRSIPNTTKYEKFQELDKPFLLSDYKKLPLTKNHYFVPIEFNSEIALKFYHFYSIDKIFINSSTGIKTHHDTFLIANEKDSLKKRLNLFFNGNDDQLKKIGMELKASKSWNPKDARSKGNLNKAINSIDYISYRGFSKEFLIYDNIFVERGRPSFMAQISPKNPVICTTKQLMKPPFSHTFITTIPFDICVLSTNSKESAYGFPLFFDNKSNITKPTLPYIVSEIEIFYYVYGILNSNQYRKKYEKFLERDFPRIPFPDEKDPFIEMSNLGKKLSDLYLFKDKDLDHTQFLMSESTDYKIYNVRSKDKDNQGNQISDTYDPITQRIYFKKRLKSQIQMEKEGDRLDDITWIGGISQAMWDFEIGGRQQLKQWLFARRFGTENKKNTIPRPLTNEELEYFLVMCDAIKKTIEILPEIDTVYKKIDP